jgi:diaminohydroxyphosphoribosylaminopyrimidine deaminase/5-amino-6-(5-phosphoribosylamino)uracil reductase
VLEAEGRELNETFIRRITGTASFLCAKWAMTLDGKIACYTGYSQWISGEASRSKAHELRWRSDGILTGIGTVLADDPSFTVRHIEGRTPPRIVLDSYARLPVESSLFNTIDEGPLILATTEDAPVSRIKALQNAGVTLLQVSSDSQGINIRELLRILRDRGISNLLIEAGGEVMGSAFEKGVIDKIAAFVAPVIVGGKEATSPVEGQGVPKIELGYKLKSMKFRQYPPDFLLEALVKKSEPHDSTEEIIETL